MFLIYALLIVLLMAAAVVIMPMVFNYKTKFICFLRIVLLIACFLLGVLNIVMGTSVSSDINFARTRYDDLMLYYNVVNNSTNEYVRYNYFEKVGAYNNYYTNLEANSDSLFLAAYFPKDWNTDFGPINFQLHGDEYVG